MMKNLVMAGFAFALGLLVLPAIARNEGTAVGVNPDALSRSNASDRVLVVGDGISVGETLVTGPQGQVQVVFADDTRMVVGPNSSLLVETYLMRNGGTAEKLAVNALAGSFRFISGRSPKPAYQINTPTAAIAVRGTEFDIIVAPQETRVMLYGGAVQLCSSGGACEQLTNRCEIGQSSATEANIFTGSDPERQPMAGEFYYAHFQSPLMGQFRINGASQCLKVHSRSTEPAASIGASGSADAPGNRQMPTPPSPPPCNSRAC